MAKDSLKNSKNSNQEFEFCAGNQYMSKNEVKCTKSSHGCTSKFLNFFGSNEFYAYKRAYFYDCGSVRKFYIL